MRPAGGVYPCFGFNAFHPPAEGGLLSSGSESLLSSRSNMFLGSLPAFER